MWGGERNMRFGFGAWFICLMVSLRSVTLEPEEFTKNSLELKSVEVYSWI
jgi:hypothetical protein